MKFSFALAAALLSLGLTQPTLSATLDSSVVIVQCSVTGNSVTGNSFDATAASASRGIRKVVMNNECADELELYLRLGFKIRSTLGDQNGLTVTYTLLGPRANRS
ncbi:MAG: hypothetical protein H0T87_08770 [Gammaproteobacteria bacterium]|nr:hypothetical protein [Gammaproteobacteria bacterium]